jgi:hypothetical protein
MKKWPRKMRPAKKMNKIAMNQKPIYVTQKRKISHLHTLLHLKASFIYHDSIE